MNAGSFSCYPANAGTATLTPAPPWWLGADELSGGDCTVASLHTAAPIAHSFLFAHNAAMRDDAQMRCDVAREALSARLDGEDPDVLAYELDAHLGSCRRCRVWLIGAAAQTRQLAAFEAGHAPDLTDQIMATAGFVGAPRYRRLMAALHSGWRRCGLIGVGVFQVAIAAAQISGVDFGMLSASGHGATTGAHLMHESTAWLFALGLTMVVAGVWTVAAVGVAAIVSVYSAALTSYVLFDAFRGEVTAARIASHVPLVIGTVFALLVARDRGGARTFSQTTTFGDRVARAGITARDPSHRRRGHLRPVSRSTTSSRIHDEPTRLGWMPMTASTDDEAVTALALAAAEGNAKALEAFVKATQQDVWRFVTYLSDARSADDLTQETFLRAIGAIRHFAGRSSARTWLLAIARRAVAVHFRHIQSRPLTTYDANAEHLPDGDNHSRGFEDLVEVTAMIADLATDQREALLLTQLLGLSYADAAAVCGCPVGTIRSRVARARGALLADAEPDELTG